jgi:hypothetical protein
LFAPGFALPPQPLSRRQEPKDKAMAKGMNKGNREAKKPKKDKLAPKPAAALVPMAIRDAQEKAPSSKK